MFATQEATNLGDEAHDLVQGRRRSWYFLRGQKMSAADFIGIEEPRGVESGASPTDPHQVGDAQATTMNRVSARSMRSIGNSCSASTLQPFLITWKYISISQRTRYPLDQFDDLLTQHSKTVDGVYQETWSTLIIYNLIRLEIPKVALVVKCEQTEISFIRAFHLI